MKILISNDDGIESNGIHELAKAVRSLGDVTIVAPHRERSTAGHALTLHKPLRIAKIEEGVYTTSGTPADCIYLGIREILKEKPDLILSGINWGANLGTDVYYSGTVAAAREAALMNVKSYAFSMVDMRQIFPAEPSEDRRFSMAAAMARDIIDRTIGLDFPKHSLLNVNIPNWDKNRIKPVRITRQGFRYYASEVVKRKDPRGKDYFWIGGNYLGYEPSKDCDCQAIFEGHATLTPLTIDGTHNEFYTTLTKSF